MVFYMLVGYIWCCTLSIEDYSLWHGIVGNDTAISLPNSAAKERESLTKRKKGLLIYTVLIRLC